MFTNDRSIVQIRVAQIALGLAFVAFHISTPAQPRGSRTAPSAATPLSKLYQGCRVTVNTIERSDSITNFTKVMEPPDESLEIIRVNVTVKYLGKGGTVEFDGFELRGGDGHRGIPVMPSGSPLGKVQLFLSRENALVSSDFYFIMHRNVALLSFEPGGLVFDVSKMKITSVPTFRDRVF